MQWRTLFCQPGRIAADFPQERLRTTDVITGVQWFERVEIAKV